jgi:hypothetical protein
MPLGIVVNWTMYVYALIGSIVLALKISTYNSYTLPINNTSQYLNAHCLRQCHANDIVTSINKTVDTSLRNGCSV